MAYDNTNSGLLAKNQRKERDTHPDYTGSINVGGQEYWLSAWIKEGREGSKLEGQKFFSLALQPKQEQQQQRGGGGGYSQSSRGNPAPRPQQRPQPQRQDPRQPAGGGFDDMDDDIPF